MTLEITKEQAITLKSYLLMTTGNRREEAEACEVLAKQKNPDGSFKFPNMRKNADYCYKQNEIIEDILELMQNVDITNSLRKEKK